MSLHVSMFNNKIGRIPNVSLIPIVDCGNCKTCAAYCYAKKFYARFPEVKKQWSENSQLAHSAPKEFFRQLREVLEGYVKDRKRTAIRKMQLVPTNMYFRWHVGGDILNAGYFKRMCELAYQVPELSYLVFTKMSAIVEGYSVGLPDNLKVLVSGVEDCTRFTSGNYGETTVFHHKVLGGKVQETRDYNPGRTVFVCPGSCKDGCRHCWEAGKDTIVVFPKH